jgi:hypothetical protein
MVGLVNYQTLRFPFKNLIVKDNHWYIIKDDIGRVPLHNEKLVDRRKQCLLVMINLLIKYEIYFLHLKDEQFEGSFKEIGLSYCTINTS